MAEVAVDADAAPEATAEAAPETTVEAAVHRRAVAAVVTAIHEVRMAPPAVVARADAEVDPRAKAPDPRRGEPGPAVCRRVDVRRRILDAVRRVDVLVAVRHPDPAVLPRVDPLTAGGGRDRRRRRRHLDAELRLRLWLRLLRGRRCH